MSMVSSSSSSFNASLTFLTFSSSLEVSASYVGVDGTPSLSAPGTHVVDDIRNVIPVTRTKGRHKSQEISELILKHQ